MWVFFIWSGGKEQEDVEDCLHSVENEWSRSKQWDLSARSRSNVLRSCKKFTPGGFSANESQ